MTDRRLRFFMLTLFVLTALVGVLSVGNLLIRIGQPFGGYLADYNVGLNRWFMSLETPPWWPGVVEDHPEAVRQACPNTERVGLSFDDRGLLTIDGQPYDLNALQRFATAQAAGRTCLTVTTDHMGQPIERLVPIVLFSIGELGDMLLPGLIVGLSAWLLALVVYRARPEAELNRVFAALNSFVAASALMFKLASDYAGIGLLLSIAGAFMASLAGPLAVHFALIFPTPSRLRTRWLLGGLYLSGGFIAGIYITSVVLLGTGGWTPLVGQLDELAYGIWMRFYMLALVFTALRWLWILARSFRTSPRLRRQMSILLLGMVIASPSLIASYNGSFGSNDRMHWYGLNLRYLEIAVPLSMAFVILRYKAFHGLSPLFMAVFVLASSAVFASLGAWLLLHTRPGAIPQQPAFMPMYLITLSLSTFWSTQSSWRGVLSRWLHRDRVSLRGIRQWSEQIVPHTNTARLPDEITAALMAEFQLERAALWVWTLPDSRFKLASSQGYWPVAVPDHLPLLPEQLMELSGPIHVQAEAPRLHTWLAPIDQLGAVEVVAPLRTAERVIGLLALGKRADEDVFDERDLEIIELIAQQAALFVLTSQQIDELRQVPARVAEAQERERFKMAQELHDTIQQFLGYLPFYLEESRSMAYQDPREADAILKQCIDDVAQAARTVREIRGSLASLQLRDGLAKPLRDHVERFGARHGLTTSIKLPLDLDEALTLERRQALYRVVQQALDNAGEHARAQSIRVALWPEEGRMHFAIEDDGCGFSDKDYVRAEANGSFGLKSMRDRIQSIGGELSIQSVVGAGTTIAGWVPIQTH